MELLLIRHGQAVDEAPGLDDAGRFLTGKGRVVTRKVARWLGREAGRRPLALWTSPLVRAVQTAEIVAEAAGLTDEVIAVAELAPGHTPDEVLARVVHHEGQGPLALVGHEPGLSQLAVRLLGEGTPWPGLKKSGVVALSWDASGPAKLRYLLLPKGLKTVTELAAREAPSAQ
jgi:phosphohistidine phosphatase